MLSAYVLDNVLIHRSKQVQAWLQAHPRMQLVTGRYSPTTTPSNGSEARSRPPGQQPNPDHRRAYPPGPRLLPPAHPAQLLAAAAPHSSPWLPEGYGHNIRQAA